ncbi:MAG: ribose ABC transporter permease [Ignavibacteriales bacterium]|nr:ribose ABC transporter permease [Ignavibacteriales bacterium]
MRTIITKLFSDYGIAMVLLLEIIIFSQLSPFFFTADNILNVSLQTSIIAIIAVGMTFVILTGGIDLSVGAIVAFGGIIATSVLKMDLPFAYGFPLACAAGLAVGTLSGAIAGICVTRFNITPFIVTMALMTIWRGASYIVTDGRPIWGLPEAFGYVGGGRLAGIPVPTIIMIVIFVCAFIVLRNMRFGRHVYALGGNKEAAWLAGINTDRTLIKVYLLSGILSALAGILLASRMNSGQPNAGMMYELDVIAAVVVGGTSLQGGRGSVVGTFVGAMLIGVLKNGLNLMNVNSYVQQVVVGVVILSAVMLDQARRKR